MIEVHSLSKNFGSVKAVNNISFSTEPGEVVGFLGPNGAGKSTTMKMIVGYISPTSGSAKVMGYDIQENPTEVKKFLGYLPENAPSYRDIKVREFLTLIAGIRGISKNKIKEEVDRVIQITFLKDVENRIIDTLSKGYRQRVCFAQAIIHSPPVLILDEPTDGLDPNQKHEIRQLIKQISKDKTIILSTHILEEMEALCNRVIIINKGELLMDSTPKDLTALSYIHNSIHFSFPVETELAVLDGLKNIEGIKEVKTNIHDSSVEVLSKDGRDISREVLYYFSTKDFVPDHFTVRQGRIDEVFSRITAHNSTQI